jgi:hypothetical protein
MFFALCHVAPCVGLAGPLSLPSRAAIEECGMQKVDNDQQKRQQYFKGHGFILSDGTSARKTQEIADRTP